MNIIDSLNQTSDKAVDVGDEYLKKTQEYYRLKVFHQIVSSLGMFCKIVAIGGILFITLIILIVAAAIALAKVLGSMIYSCLAIAGVLLLFGLILYLYRARLDTIVIKKLSKRFFA